MFEDLVDESKFKHIEDECNNCSGEDCAVGQCSACTGSCQPEAIEDELPMSFLQNNQYLTLEDQMYLKYHVGCNIQKFSMPKYAYDCLEVIDYSVSLNYGIYRFEEKELDKKTNLRTILIRRRNTAGNPIEYIELVELY